MPYRAPIEFSWQSAHQYAHARRVVAAVVLVTAGWAIGFFAGRMSAWVFPVIGTDTAAVSGALERSSSRAAAPPAQTTAVPPTPPPAVQTTAVPPTPPPADEKQKTAAAPAPPPTAAPPPAAAPAPVAAPPPAPASELVQPERSRPKEDAPAATRRDVAKADSKSPAPPDVARKADTPAQEETRGARSGGVLVNPEWTRARPIPPQRQREEERERESSMYDGPGIAECESRYTSFRRSDGTYQPYGRSSRELCPYLR
jgi:BA14K-like protein